MSETITGSESLEYDEICRVADSRRAELYTSSVLQAAAAALTDLWQALEPHNVTNALLAGDDPFASQILKAFRHTYAADSFGPTAIEIDPVGLLTEAITAAAEYLGRPLIPDEGPVMAASRAEVAYVTLPRLPETPPWGPEGDAPLVLALGCPDLAAARVVYSSAEGKIGSYEPGPWRWDLSHEPPGRLFIGTGAEIVAPPPSPAVAAEVGIITARALTGDAKIPR